MKLIGALLALPLAASAVGPAAPKTLVKDARSVASVSIGGLPIAVLRIASVGPTAVHVGDYLAIHLTADSPPGRPDSFAVYIDGRLAQAVWGDSGTGASAILAVVPSVGIAARPGARPIAITVDTSWGATSQSVNMTISP